MLPATKNKTPEKEKNTMDLGITAYKMNKIFNVGRECLINSTFTTNATARKKVHTYYNAYKYHFSEQYDE